VTTLTAGTDTFSVFGTTATLLVSDPGRLDDARAVADAELAAVDLACSRFRPDSELSRLNGCGGAVTGISELFAELLQAALRAARLTDGDVDPTCGHALAEIGYDRDFTVLQAAGLQPAGAPSPLSPRPARRVPGWRSVRLDRRRLLAQLTNGAQLDLGATAKAWAADRCAGIIAAKTGSGVLVSLGGDIAVAGPPPADRGEGRERAGWRGPGRWVGGGGWGVRVTDDHAAAPEAPGQTVTIRSGGLATSSTTVRTWAVGGQRVHHIINPATGQPAVSCWRTVSVAAGSCVDANTASTAAIIRSEAARPWLQSAGLPARLVREDGSVETTAGWPSDSDPTC
jgi:FAD:protein FMN transferase